MLMNFSLPLSSNSCNQGCGSGSGESG